MGPPQGKSVMALLDIFQGVKTWIGCENWRYCLKNQPDVQRDWINLVWTWISGNFWAWFVRKTCVKVGFQVPLGGPHLARRSAHNLLTRSFFPVSWWKVWVKGRSGGLVEGWTEKSNYSYILRNTGNLNKKFLEFLNLNKTCHQIFQFSRFWW